MHTYRFPRISRLARAAAIVSATLFGSVLIAQTPAIGAKAPDFTLSTPTGKSIQMSKEIQGHGLVLVVLRGFPGYQRPFCERQVHDFIDHASDFAASIVPSTVSPA